MFHLIQMCNVLIFSGRIRDLKSQCSLNVPLLNLVVLLVIFFYIALLCIDSIVVSSVQ